MEQQPPDPTRQREPNPPAPQAILNGMRRILSERTQWDEAPELGMLYSDDPGSVRLQPLHVPAAQWARFHDPAHLLTSMVELMRRPRGLGALRATDTVRSAVPTTFCGMFLRYEGWAPPEHRMDEYHRQRQASGPTPPIKDMPGAQEVRSGIAVDRRGRSYLAFQMRGRPRIEAGYEGQEGSSVRGGLPKVLWQLVQELSQPVRLNVPDTIPDTFTTGKKGPTAPNGL